ncbi:CobW family GTP-binding protein [Ectobacillus funiculus]|uniref:CobW family GTP-binding protein n=1 Tax=Ectobacillus funiculus TaxID=137993 RepID=A0ABV5WAL6_9BACI
MPVTLVTGFLGSGKTTLLNRILSEHHGHRFAVIVNEIGQIGIDNELIVNVEEEVMEMTNGCLCCTVREDLLVALKKLLQSRNKGEARFEGLLIETTGLANPGPIIQTFFLDETIQTYYELDGIVTVVDAYHIQQHFEKGMEAEEQVAFADLIILNKQDLVTTSQLKEVKYQIQSLNPTAQIVPTVNSEIDFSLLFGIQTFRTRDTLDIRSHFPKEHLTGVQSFVLREERPIDMVKLNHWMTAVVSELGEYLYRYKGIIAAQGMDRRVVFQGVHTLFAASYDRPWKQEEERKSEVVFIGKGLNKVWFEEHFHNCVADH